MAQIQPVLLVNGTPLVGVVRCSTTWKIGGFEDISYTINGAGVPTATPGDPPSSTRVIGISLDNGASVDARLLSGGTQVDNDLPVLAEETGSSTGQVLSTTFVDRLTAQQVRLDDIFNGSPGSVISSAGRTLVLSGVLPNFAGLASFAPGGPGDTYPAALTFSYVVDAFISSIVLDIDSNRDTCLNIVQAVADRLGSYIDPQRAQFYIDSGDLGVGGTPSVVIGSLGTSPKFTFTDPVDGTSVQPILTGTQYQPQQLQTCRMTSFQGGTTNHGMPDGGILTDIVTVNHNITDATGNYRSGMPVVSLYGDRNNGGVYFLPGDGALHPMSQAMGVRGLWYDESLPLIYAATDAGVYQHSPDPGDPAPWARLGGMALPCTKVLSSFGRVYALVTFPSNGAVHVLMYAGPGTGLPEPTKGYGFDDWQSVYTTAGLSDFSVLNDVGGANPTVYAISSSATGYILRHVIGSTAIDTRLAIGGTPPTQVAVGLDSLVSYAIAPGGRPQATVNLIYVRTDSGSIGLWTISPGGALSLVNSGGFTDAYGNSVTVNQVYQHSPGIVQWNGGLSRTVAVFAATNAGIFANPNLNGSGVWLPTDGQSNLGDFNVDRVASAPPRAWLGETLTQMWGISGRSIYRSPDGTIHWLDIIAKPLDPGPAFFAAYKAANGVYPNNTTTQLTWPKSGSNANKYIVYRGLNGLGEFTYHMVNPASTAPAGSHRFTELSQNSSPSQVREIASSGLILDAMARFLAYTEKPQTILTIQSLFSDTADALRFLRPTDQVHVTGTVQSLIVGVSDTPIVFVTYSGLVCFVLSHSLNYDADQDPNTITTVTKLGVLCLDDRSDPSKVSSDLWGKISRMQLYNNGKH